MTDRLRSNAIYITRSVDQTYIGTTGDAFAILDTLNVYAGYRAAYYFGNTLTFAMFSKRNPRSSRGCLSPAKNRSIFVNGVFQLCVER